MLKYFVLVIFCISFASATRVLAIADACIETARPTLNFGSDQVGSYNTRYTPVVNQYGLLYKFNISTIPANITWANVSIWQDARYPDEAFGPQFSINVWIISNNWTESTVTYNNKPMPQITQFLDEYYDGDDQYIVFPVKTQLQAARAINQDIISFEVWGEIYWNRAGVLMKENWRAINDPQIYTPAIDFS